MNIYNTFVISDTHFNHPRMLRQRAQTKIGGFSCRSEREMNEMLIENWNSVVGPKDHVIVVGDFTWKGLDYDALIKALHGRKTLVHGNHDPSEVRKSPHWEETGDIIRLNIGEKSKAPREDCLFINFCHYPMRSWHKSFDGSFHIYGHTHADDMRDRREFNAGVDMSIDPCRPRRLDHVISAMAAGWFPAKGGDPLPDGDPRIMERFRRDYERPLDMRALLEEKKIIAEKVAALENVICRNPR